MQISDKRLLEFNELMRKKVGEERYSKMTEQELLASAISLVTTIKIVYKPVTKEDYEKTRAWEEKQNIENALAWILKEDQKQNPHSCGEIKNLLKLVDTVLEDQSVS